MTDKILLGFEVGTGEPVYIIPQHLVALGMTQLSGKTTANQAIIVRSGAKAVAFITKRGESGFTDFKLMRPYYKSQRGWQYVESLIDVALGEKVKYEPRMRYAIMKVSRGMKDLRDVREKAVKYLTEAKKEWDKEVYSKLIAYLDLVLPELEAIDFAEKVELQEGVNVMDLVDMKLETQQLIIASTLRYIYQHLSDVIAIIPEAWEHLPQSRRTPVKFVAEQYIRKGAAVKNYLWLDSQDIGGMDKTPLRQVSTWIMGRMMEAHEVERILKQLLGFKIPAREIQTLSLGHFYVTVGNEIKKVYVLPAGIPEQYGIEVAKGIRTPESVKTLLEERRKTIKEDDDLVWKEKFDELERKFNSLVVETRKEVGRLEKENADLKKQNVDADEMAIQLETLNHLKKENKKLKEDIADFRKLGVMLDKLLPKTARIQIPASPTEKTKINMEHTELDVTIHDAGPKTVKMSSTNKEGQILFVALKDLPREGWTTGQMNDAMAERGWPVKSSTLSAKLSLLTGRSILVKTKKGYRLPTKVKFSEA